MNAPNESRNVPFCKQLYFIPYFPVYSAFIIFILIWWFFFSDIAGTFKMQVDEMLFPLTKIYTDMFVLYKSPGTEPKVPVMFSLPPVMSATPLITLTVADSNLAAARMTKKFNLTVFLKKMKTNIQIEVNIFPKFFTFLSLVTF